MSPGQIVRVTQLPLEHEHCFHSGAFGILVCQVAPWVWGVLVNGIVIRLHDGWLDAP